MTRSDEPTPTLVPGAPDTKGFRHYGDGIAGEINTARVQGYNPGTLGYVDVQVDANGVVQTSAGAGGGGAATIADGADVAQGATTDLSSASTVVGLLKAIKTAITGTLTVAGSLGRSWTLSSGTDSVAVTGSVTATGPLTDTQLRATPVPVSGTVTASGPLTDTQLRATPVPVSGTVTASGPLTDTQLRATPVPVSGTVTASGPLTDTQLRLTPVPVSGTVTANATLSAETTKVIGTVNQGTSPWVTSAAQSGAWTVTVSSETATAAEAGALPAVAKVIAGYDPDNAVVRAVRIDAGRLPTVDHVARRQLEEMTLILISIRDTLAIIQDETEVQ